MYESFYGLREKPFSLVPDPSFLYLGKKHRIALAMLEYGVMNRAGIIVVSGEIGSGKTTLIRALLNRLEGNVSVGLISNTHQSLSELLRWICLAYGLPYQTSDSVILYDTFVQFVISQYAKGKRTLLIVDEAQNLGAAALEELRLLSNINADKDNVLQLVLVGQPELRELLCRPELAQLGQRISVAYHLGPLDAHETDEYIGYRLSVAGGDPRLFEPMAARLIHHQSGGIPRLINRLCETALVYAYAEGRKVVDARLVYDVVKEQAEMGFFDIKGEGLAGKENTNIELIRKT